MEHSNTIYTKATRSITNHAPIGKYWFWFFFNESFKCSCSDYFIKPRNYILHHCRWFNKYWNPNRELLASFIFFLFFLFLFFCLFFLFFSFSYLVYISSYKVAIIVYHHILYNKILIFLQKVMYHIMWSISDILV